MSATPQIKIIGITKEELIKEVDNIEKWYGDREHKPIYLSDGDRNKQYFADGKVINYGESVNSIRARIADGTIDKFIKQYQPK